MIARFTDAIVTELERERQAGLALDTGDSRAITATLMWSTAQCLYVAGLGVDSSLPDEQSALPPLITLWRSTLYGN